MTQIYSAKVAKALGGGYTRSVLTSVSGSASTAFATISIVGDIRMAVTGTFQSATVSLQVRDPNGVYAEVSGSPITAAKDVVFSFPQYCKNTFRVSHGQTAAKPNLSVWLQGSDN